MDGKTGESLDSDGGNDGRGNNLPESTGHTVNHEMETPLNFKMRTLERPETVTAATTAAAENTELGQWPVGHAVSQERQHCQKKLVSWLEKLRDSFNGGGSLSTFGNT